MTLDTFFEKFDLFAEAPDAMAKMRKLVLQLAVQGNLKSDCDELGFPRVRLDSLGSWAQGCGFPISEQGHADRPILFAKVSDMNLAGNKREILKTAHTIDEAAAKRLRIKVHPPGTVIFPKIGGAIATNKRRVLVLPTAIDNNCSGLIPNKSCSTNWLFLVLSAIDFAEYQSGTSVPAVNQGVLGEIEVSLPLLAEQKRIVAKVDELMALCDQLEAQQQERKIRLSDLARASLARFAEAPTPANLDFLFHHTYAIPPADLRKSILTLAVQGKLVPQDPNDEPAEECLTRIGLKNMLEQDETADSLPSSWSRVRFEDIALTAGGVTLGRKLGDRKTVTLPYLRVANVKRGEIDLSIIKEVTIAEDEIERYGLRKNDLLMTEGGDWDKVGRAAIWAEQIPICLHQNHIFRSRMRSPEISPEWFECYFNSPYGRRYFESASKQTTNLASINMRQVRGCPVPFPPLVEQRRIVAKVEELMALVDMLEAQLVEADARAESLLDAMVGQVSQNGSDITERDEKIIDLQSRPEFVRALLASEIVSRLSGDTTFGQTKFQKVLYLAEYMQELSEIESRPVRYARGPHDPELIKEVESKMKALEWYQEAPRRDGLGHQYLPLQKAGEHAALFEQVWPEKQSSIRALLDLMKTWKTERCERFATLYAAWNDLLIWGHEVTEESILREVLERWHTDKVLIPRSKWIEMLDWMESKGYVPTGFGRATTHAPQGELF